ncbi:MAG: ribonuclease J [Deltaproteobacteria bacterium RBG_13_60_28]|nr:MAG: ribonuclease J [Deltaproteobacteria bacterium RBG_13_60_28]
MGPEAATDSWVDLTFLGGLGEIGLNMMTVETATHLVVVDAGLMFPEDHMLGIDIVIPDFSYLRERRDKLTALILTHGHEDHIGGVPFLLKEFHLPVYGTPLTLALLREKLREHRLLDEADLREIHPREPLILGPFDFEFIPVPHSIVDGVGFALRTPQGVLIHSGDFKVDQTPVVGAAMDLNRFARYGEQGVLALMSDSTNAERPGYTLSEREIGATLEEFIREAPGRVIVAVFASHIPRLHQIVRLAAKHGRKILFNGKSMLVNTRIAKELGYLEIPPGMEINVGDLGKLPPGETIIVTTGSQGEPMSALARIALEAHKQIHIQKGDLVILSSKFIPGNERAITTVINNLYRLGAEVVYQQVADIHVSGHASQEELKLLLNLTRPRYFIPIHGEMRHLVKHTHLARAVGIPEEGLLLAKNGEQVRFEDGNATISGGVEVGRVFVDGKGVGDVSRIVLRDRRHLAGDGLVIALVALDPVAGKIVSEPDLITRGFTLEEEQAPLLEQARKIFQEIVERGLSEPNQDWLEIQAQAGKALRKLFFKALERRPMILPLILTL